ncbi:DUF4883 family protein [Clostridium sp.]|uniref:DUF4883 family protein n=1 Tax=Clostridium sp. TaxID=1506 RepID=UPI003F39C31C
MKRYLKLIFLFLFILILPGCGLSSPEYIIPKSKPSTHYYTNEIYKKLKNQEAYNIKIFDLDVYKYYDVDSEEHSIMLEFIESLNDKNFEASIEEDLKPRYKLIIEFEDSKYLINAYNESLISIYPWDGVYKEDVLSLEGVPDYYNVFKFCEYIDKISRGFEG